MNARDYLREDFEFEANDRQSSARSAKPSAGRRTYSKKRAKSPQQFNGIHRRRKKKIRW